MKASNEEGLANWMLLGCWFLSAALSALLVNWSASGGLCMLPNEFVAASVAFDGILIAAITVSVQVQKGQNKYLLKLGNNHKNTIFVIMLILVSASLMSFALLRPTDIGNGRTAVGIGHYDGTTCAPAWIPGSRTGYGSTGLYGFVTFFMGLTVWGFLLSASMLTGSKPPKD